MVQKDTIYAATHAGLDILRYYYPFLTEEMAATKKKFRLREERDASASMRLHGGCYRITDFGNDAREYTPIDVVMREEGLTYVQAVLTICSRYGISEEQENFVKPTKTERPAAESEHEGDFFFEEHEPTPQELSTMGRGVTAEHFHALGWKALTSYTVVKGGQAVTRSSAPGYPIFARQCRFLENGKEAHFYKLYQPKNDKQFRFMYLPAGKKPKDYVNGLHEAVVKWKELNAGELDENTSEERRLTAEWKKLPDITICSGERDAICALARGATPVWLNSETADMTETMYNTLKRYAKTVYNIPDIDATGRRQGKALALKFLDIETVWLPDTIRRFKDWRGNAYKDFRDWCELYPAQKDFQNLLNLSLSASFWRWKPKTGVYDIDLECLYYFLRINDFFIHHDRETGLYAYMHQRGQIIERVTPKEIKAYLKEWARSAHLPKDIRNVILSNRITDTLFENLDTKELDFKTYSKDAQYFFFRNETWKVTADGVSCTPGDNVICYDYNVIPHDVRILPPMFNVTRIGEDFSIKVGDTSSKYFCFLINSSRIYWRDELEAYADTLPEEERAAYLRAQKFAITSPRLSREQNQEQVKCLLSKMFTIGYYLHRYKNPAHAWAAYAMDWKMDENGENNGRSGKSFFFKFADLFLNNVKLSGRNKKLMENQHVYDQVTKHTEMVLIDDCNRNITPDLFFDNITSDLTINPKNQQPYTIRYEESPKFAFTTNYVPRQFDPSSVGRLLFLVFSDYYHIRTNTNNYRENRQIFDDFGKSLFSDYDEAEYNADINFFVQCTRFYMECTRAGLKIQPNLDNIIKRSYKANLTESFEDWAGSYFAPESTHVDRLIDRQNVYQQCKADTGQNKLTSQGFLKQLKAFIELADHLEELNPAELAGSNGRIIRNVRGESREMLYIKTKRHVQ